MSFVSSCIDTTSSQDLEDEPSFSENLASSFDGRSCDQPDQDGMEQFLSRSWSMPIGEAGKTLGDLIRLDDPERAIHGSGQSSDDGGMHIPYRSKSDILLDNNRAVPFDFHPPNPKGICGFSSYDNCSSACESCHSTPIRLAELKNWLWLQPEQRSELNKIHCIRLKWLDRRIASLRNLIKRTSVKTWLKERRKEKLQLKNAHANAALSLASVAAAVAAVAAATATSTMTEKHSRTGVVMASAASLVAARCADFAEEMGAEHSDVAASVSLGRHVKSAADILNLTASASSYLQGAKVFSRKTQRETHMYTPVSLYERQPSPSTACSSVSVVDDSEADCYHSYELLARGCEFLMRSNTSKLYWRFISVILDRHKQVILKLRSSHLAGFYSKTKKRVVLDILLEIPAWPGRSLIHDGEERCYFGLVTSHGTLEFECKSEFDYQLWTDGISHLLLMAKQNMNK